MDPNKKKAEIKYTRPQCKCLGCPNHKFGCRTDCESWHQYEKETAEWKKKKEQTRIELQGYYDSNEIITKEMKKRRPKK